jgi:aspartate carbamoyltransferase catalytic subunit
MLTHLVSISDVSREKIEKILHSAEIMASLDKTYLSQILNGLVLGVMFYQTSTRTRLSFEASMLKLGGKVIGFSDYKQTRAGDFFSETLDDTVRIVAGMVNCIVIRHYSDGAAASAAVISPVPIINAGDGSHEHPTQALCDLWTIRKRVGQISELKIALVGSPHCRATQSMIKVLVKCGIKKMYFVCPPNVDIMPCQSELLARESVQWESLPGVAEAIDIADVIWMIPFLLPDFHNARSEVVERPHLEERFVLRKSKMHKGGHSPFVLHTGPRGEELDPSMDSCEKSLYFSQAEDAIQMRMAILANLMGCEP